MLATGSEEFIDIILPLLNNDDQQVRLNAYRAWGEFSVTSLGKKWRQVVKGWKEEQRAEFIGEVVRERSMADVAEEFGLTDSSPRVRVAVIHALEWIDATEALSRVLTAFDNETFKNLLRDRVIDTIPVGLKSRALLAYEEFLQKADDSRERLRIRLAQASLGAEHNLEGVKEDLTKWPPEKIADNDEWLLNSALEIIRKTDPQWVSYWTADRIAHGLLWADRWITFVASIPEGLKRELLEKISDKTVEEIDTRAAVSVLAATADANLAVDVFSRLCILRAEISTAPDETAQSLWKTSGRLQDLFRTISPNIAVSGMLSRLSPQFNGIEYDLVIDLFGSIGGEDSDLRSSIEETQRQLLRNYLKEGVQFALNQDDFNGHLKAHLALALARVGEPSDMDDVHRLIRADIDRWRRGRAALLRGERGPLTDGATMSWTNWYVRAVSWLDPNRAEETFLDLLCESEYEKGASTALIELSKIQSPEKPLGLNRLDYCLVWEGRRGRRSTRFDEERRFRYAAAIKKRLSTLMADRAEGDDPDWFNLRLKELAQRLAVIDGSDSAEFVMEIMILPSHWDQWTRVDVIEALLFGGARMKAERVLEILNATIDYTMSHLHYDQQARYLLQRCLCLLSFLEPPATGIVRIREVVAATPFLHYELREIVTALGHSRSNDALEFLLELARAGGNRFEAIKSEWIEAMADLDIPESKRVLMSFIDPDTSSLVSSNTLNTTIVSVWLRTSSKSLARNRRSENAYICCAIENFLSRSACYSPKLLYGWVH